MRHPVENNRRRFLRIAGGASLAAIVTSVLAKGSGDRDRSSQTRAPALFVGHGSPMNAIESNRFTDGWASMGQALGRSRAILSISAHWETDGGSFVTASANPRVIYDMRGFPEALYRVRYPALGAPRIAAGMARGEGTYPIATSNEWGLDHGTWSVLVHLRPEADIPVIQLSLNRDLSLLDHLALGRELAGLRDMGVAIMGTGNIVHNLRLRRMDDLQYDWAHAFDDKVAALIDDRNFEGTTEFSRLGAPARLSHPTLEHYIPMMYVLGALGTEESFRWFNLGFTKATLGMRSLIST